MNKRAQQARATKQKILDAAEALVAEKGFGNVSVDDITRACGIGHGTFYHYFKSVEELSIYLTRSPYEYLNKTYESGKDLPAMERFRAVLNAWFSIAEKFNLHFTRQAMRLYTDESLKGEYGENMTHIDLGMKLLRKCLTEAVETGVLLPETPVEQLAMEIMFSVQGSMMYHCKHADSFDVLQWGTAFSERVFRVYLADYLVQYTDTMSAY